jgi:hypothetical protein
MCFVVPAILTKIAPKVEERYQAKVDSGSVARCFARRGPRFALFEDERRRNMIDDAARFVSVSSFTLGSSDVAAMSQDLQRAVQQQVRTMKGFIGCIVMVNDEKPLLMVVSLWESRDDWSRAQYDVEIGRAVTAVVETAKSYDLQTYDTITVVRA